MDDIKNDPRFAHIVSDPKFQLMPKSKKKVKIDSRFQSVFSSQHFSHKTDIDKRGRPILDASKRNKHVMQRFYDLSDDDSVTLESDTEVQDVADTKQVKKNKSRESIDEATHTKQKKRHKTKQETRQTNVKPASNTRDKLKETVDDNDKNSPLNSSISHQTGIIEGLDDADTSTDDEDDDELPEFTQEHIIDETELHHKWNELHTDAPTVVESTHRLAVCNMDWDFVRAQDLFVLFKSFVPEGGSVKSVTIYPSEFGKERMAEEARLGPREIREQSKSDHMVSEEGSRKKKKKILDQKQVKKSTKDQGASQTEKLREYQLNRLRYYFAVVECDSVSTAEVVYSECDGREYLLSSVRLDLRFIPNNMTFDDTPKDVFSEAQSILEYEPSRFSTTALCQAKVDVTWDETDFDRLSRRIAGLQHKELESIVEENKYADIIAPPESDTDEEVDDQHNKLNGALDGAEGDSIVTEEDKIAMYRRLLMDEIEEADENDSEKETGEKEYVWQPGLKSSAVKKMQKKERKQTETGVVNEYLEKKREKKKQKKAKKTQKKAGDKLEIEDTGDDVVGDLQKKTVGHRVPAHKKRKIKQAISDDKMLEDAADLELLVMDVDNGLKQTSESKVELNKKKKKMSKKKKLSDDKDDYPLDVDDPRFAALYTSHHYHIDPTSSQFKKTKNMSTLVNEQIRRRGKSGTSEPTQDSHDTGSSLSQALIKSLKLKMQK